MAYVSRVYAKSSDIDPFHATAVFITASFLYTPETCLFRPNSLYIAWIVAPSAARASIGANSSSLVRLSQDPEAFAEAHGGRNHDGVYKVWREMQRVQPVVEEDEGGIQV